MIDIVASSRAEFHPAEKLMRFTRPDAAVIGDELLIVVWSHAGETVDLAHVPAGWTLEGPGTLTDYTLWTFTRAVALGDVATVDFPIQAGGAVAHEWAGMLFVVRGGYDGIVEEITGNEFAAQQPVVIFPVAGTEQATGILLGFFVAAGTNIITPDLSDAADVPYPTVPVDAWAQFVLERYTVSVAYRRPGETGTLRFGVGAVAAPVSGFAIFVVLRAGRPATPDVLYDVIPGNLGLLAKDTRAGAEGFGTAKAIPNGGGIVGPGH